mmetsp:Transcript_15278/g.21475  ORF Transcript_15278/g.21475 Transcript_15278/m.21475 type:complete len:511 (-) Transcript_15278:388-1920(-)|eukprot:CAMPEP_0184487730 /NCGR_PEP_ID=MMETSP0113_2-20130426/10300_1 /TAXON_ID=91329 /ORGANISM="Norrisiella sphaerica, Strain BC52" /LENGTH=510 /DNA_ID=CAMNT_0026870125 /DNA_START=101 /DNA_END=1633 /DNA_ORIENTATION=+
MQRNLPYSSFKDLDAFDQPEADEDDTEHSHLSEYPLSYQNAAGVQARSIVFVGSVSDPPEEKGLLNQFVEWTFSGQTMTVFAWLVASVCLASLYMSYRVTWRTHLHPEHARSGDYTRGSGLTSTSHSSLIRCEPIPMWTITSSIIMISLSCLSSLVMCCEKSNTCGEVFSIWLIGCGHCILGISLCAGFIWVCVIGWVWVLESPAKCGPALWNYVILFLPLLCLLFCIMFMFRVVWTLDKSDDNDPVGVKEEDQGICCPRLRFMFLDNRSLEERQPLYGKSIEDEVQRTTADHDEKNVGSQPLLCRPAGEEFVSGADERVMGALDVRWRKCIRGQGTSEAKKGDVEDNLQTIEYSDFADHFAEFFDEIGSTMTKRLFNSLADFNGRLNLQTLKNGVYRWGQGSMRDKLTLVFDMWDLNRNGNLDTQEIRDMMKMLAKSSGTSFLSHALNLRNADSAKKDIEERVEAILERFEASLDHNCDNTISLEEWLKFAEGDEDIHHFLERFTVRSF